MKLQKVLTNILQKEKEKLAQIKVETEAILKLLGPDFEINCESVIEEIKQETSLDNSTVTLGIWTTEEDLLHAYISELLFFRS